MVIGPNYQAALSSLSGVKMSRWPLVMLCKRAAVVFKLAEQNWSDLSSTGMRYSSAHAHVTPGRCAVLFSVCWHRAKVIFSRFIRLRWKMMVCVCLLKTYLVIRSPPYLSGCKVCNMLQPRVMCGIVHVCVWVHLPPSACWVGSLGRASNHVEMIISAASF